MKGYAHISDCLNHRYYLSRIWDESLPRCTWLMLNPSTADAHLDDPTIKRCIAFAKSWGFGSIGVINIYTFRTKSPGELKEFNYMSDNETRNAVISAMLPNNGFIVAGWGNHARKQDVAELFEFINSLGGSYTISCLGVNQNGSPKHPLYIKSDTKPTYYNP